MTASCSGSFLRHLSDGKASVRIAVRGFVNNRGALACAMSPDFAAHKHKLQGHARQAELYAAQSAALAAGEQVPVPRPPAKAAPSLHCSSPVSVRFHFDERHGAWYVQATFDRPPKTSQAKPTLVLGADLNPDHLAWSLLKADGNPVSFGRIALDLSGSAEQNRDRLGVAVAALVEVARRHGAAIAVETLDFTRARAQLRSSSRRLKRLVSSFAYHKFFAVLSSRCAREDVAVISVNPAWSSVLGQANFAGVRGISVDQGAAAVLARRALGLCERVRPAVARRLPRSAADGHTQCLGVLAKALTKRGTTWEPRGFCSRSEPAPRSPAAVAPGDRRLAREGSRVTRCKLSAPAPFSHQVPSAVRRRGRWVAGSASA